MVPKWFDHIWPVSVSTFINTSLCEAHGVSKEIMALHGFTNFNTKMVEFYMIWGFHGLPAFRENPDLLANQKAWIEAQPLRFPALEPFAFLRDPAAMATAVLSRACWNWRLIGVIWAYTIICGALRVSTRFNHGGAGFLPSTVPQYHAFFHLFSGFTSGNLHPGSHS